ncbi:MAG TPA: 50S ribosomal protein L3 [Candidatus Binatia bacterium]
MATAEAAAVPARKKLGLLGRKIGMTQLLLPTGRSVPVTVIEAGPCVVVQRKTPERDGYTAVQLGFAPSKPHRETKAAIGHAAKAGKGTFSLLREFWGGENLELGATLTVADLFRDGEKVHVTGTTKGRGYSGVIKRHGFGGFPGTHGTHEYFRHGGSIGNRSFPGRVFKGKRMAGRYGNERVTTRNLTVVQVRGEQNLLLVRGSVAGPRGGYVIVRPAGGVEK